TKDEAIEDVRRGRRFAWSSCTVSLFHDAVQLLRRRSIAVPVALLLSAITFAPKATQAAPKASTSVERRSSVQITRRTELRRSTGHAAIYHPRPNAEPAQSNRRRAGASPDVHTSEPQPKIPPLIPAPGVRQHSRAACGDSTMASIFALFGKVSYTPSQLARK